MIERILKTVPVAVLIDRSRDTSAGRGLVDLLPTNVFLTTDNRRRLAAKRMADYDIVAVCGNGMVSYSGAERRAVRSFVRRGGSLLLTACSGAFEVATERTADRMAVNDLARLFGFEFLSASDLPANLHAVRGYDRKNVVLTAMAKGKVGLTLGETPVGRPGPLSTPPGAQVLMRAKLSGLPIIAIARFGRGKVMVCNDLAIWGGYGHWSNPWNVAHWLMPLVPRRRTPASRPADMIELPYSKEAGGRITVHCTSMTRRHADRIRKLAGDVFDQMLPLHRGRKKPKALHVSVDSGSEVSHQADGPRGQMRIRVGAGSSDATIVAGLTGVFAWPFLLHHLHWQLRLFLIPMVHALQWRVLRKLGFGDCADKLEAACAKGKRVDLGRVYIETTMTGPWQRLWKDIEAEFGSRAIEKFARAVPRKDPFQGVAWDVFGAFDVFAWLMAQAFGKRAYDWLEAQGHTLRRMPIEKPGSDKFKAAQHRAICKQLTDSTEKASCRHDAALALAAKLEADKVPVAACVRKANAKRVEVALPAAMRLLQVKDMRGRGAMRRWVRSSDRALSAVAALTLVTEANDKRAADSLVRLATDQDTRFKLSAGYALRLADDRRASRFAFDKLPGCRIKRFGDGEIKVLPVVDGYEVANVFCLPLFRPSSLAAVFSSYYVAWVHTDQRWRRRGMARLAIEAAIDYRWDRLCATTSLHTGTRNVAHPLYRSQGLTDYIVHHELTRHLHTEPAVRLPKGIAIRSAAARDAVAAVVNECNANLPVERVRLVDWPGQATAYVATKGRKIVGVASAEKNGDSAWLNMLTVPELIGSDSKPDQKQRERIGRALLSATARAMLRRKAKTIKAATWHSNFCPDEPFVCSLLARCGYGTHRTDFVEMHRINRLDQYLAEIAATLELRLSGDKRFVEWSGSIWLKGGRLKACVHVTKGKVRITAKPPARPAIAIVGDEFGIQRVALGIATPFEEYLQLQVNVSSGVGSGARDLLEVMFPCVIREF